MADHTSVPLRTTHFLYRDCSLLPWALGRYVHPTLPRGTLFQLGYGTHHWHSNSSSVCSRRRLRDCHCTRLSDSSLLIARFEVSVYYYYYIIHARSLPRHWSVSSLAKNQLFSTAPEIDEPLLQFIHTMDLSLAYTTLHNSPLVLQPFSGNSFISFFGAVPRYLFVSCKFLIRILSSSLNPIILRRLN